MTPLQFEAFSSFRDEFKMKISQWSAFNNELFELQNAAASTKGSVPDYEIQTPVCYNRALDDITPEDDIRLIVIGDNPGKNEQLEKNRRYLVGLAGKLGEKFFAENPELGIDFRKNVIILNKTPVHSARTEQLKFIIKNGSPAIVELISESQKWMAKATAELHMKLGQEKDAPQLWLVGYAELKNKGVFLEYRDTLLETYKKAGKLDYCTDNVFTYQHFSMNRFTIDLNDYSKKRQAPDDHKADLTTVLRELGSLHRKEIFGV